MDDNHLIFVCDHRGEGLSERMRPLSSSGLRLEVSQNLRETIELLDSRRPSLVMVDALAHGGQVELETIQELCTGDAPIPVLLVADRDDPLPTILASRIFDHGLWDLVYREAPTEEFLRRMDRLRAQARRLGEIDDLRYQAAHDDRTQLLRPSAFQSRLLEHFSAAQRHHFEIAFALVDLDRFGRINKDYDHTVGDRVIACVGAAIRSTLRAEDVAGRLGGDEFGVILPYTSRLDAALVVTRLRDEIHKLSGEMASVPEQIVASASIGFETFDGTDLRTVDDLRRHAEIAMQRAKQQGGNGGVYYRSLVARGEGDPGDPGDEPLTGTDE